MKNIIIFGTNDLAELSLYYFTHDSDWEVHGFTKNKEFIEENEHFCSIDVVPFEELEQYYSPSDYYLFAPIINNKLREKIYNEGIERGYQFVSYISSKCTNYASLIGNNCFILEDNTLQPFTTIGNNVILWSGNHIGHHSKIEDNVFFTSHVVMSGHCHIKRGAFLGVNSTLRDGIEIGENSIIGMGSTVTKNVPDEETWIGSPAKIK
jgi:sugar O-acyltransferase (sialic acid O-acetyltransferase NeuD family)